VIPPDGEISGDMTREELAAMTDQELLAYPLLSWSPTAECACTSGPEIPLPAIDFDVKAPCLAPTTPMTSSITCLTLPRASTPCARSRTTRRDNDDR
jgi:hypothetical protein